MKVFKTIDSLVGVLSSAFREGEGEVGRSAFRKVLQDVLEFSAKEAELYSSVVLANNSNNSANFVSMNANKLSGKWIRDDSSGSAGNLVVSKTETWLFNVNLTYEHKHESYEGYVSPFGSSYSMPKSWSEHGIWAPSDRPDDIFAIIAISYGGTCQRFNIGWLGATETLPRACSIDGVRFARQ